MSEKHIFALYTNQLSSLQNLASGGHITVSDTDLWRRIYTILHLKQDEECIIFDGQKSLHINLVAAQKKGVVAGVINAVEKVLPYKPQLHLFQSILKREAFNDALYLAAQMGASSVTPLITKKVQRTWGGPKESERLLKVMISACEQAKQYAIPIVNEPIDLSHLPLPTKNPQVFSMFCEPAGVPLFECLHNIATHPYHTINVFIGPEGGFIQEEQNLLNAAQIVPCALTKSILRSQEAVAVTLGAIRSVAR